MLSQTMAGVQGAGKTTTIMIIFIHLDVETRTKEQVEWEQAREEVKVEEFPEGAHSYILNFKSGCFNPASLLLPMSCFNF